MIVGQEVENRSDLVSHGQYARCYGGAATNCLKRTDNVSRNRKVSIGTARNRYLCQHQRGAGLAFDTMVSISKPS